MTIIDRETFLKLPTDEVAKLVRAAGPQVCVFPINGTRRWFMLEYLPKAKKDSTALYKEYPDIIIRRYSELFQLFFDHGVDTLLTPLFGPDLLERGDDYTQLASKGLASFATHPLLINFYEAYHVRVRFYGDYRKFFNAPPYIHLPNLFDTATAQTVANDRHHLFFGLFANDATETVAEMAVRYYTEHGRVPDRRILVEMYYGEYIERADFFIGFDEFSAFDMPLIATGNEDLYFTVSPSPYFTEQQLRDILYDHIYARHKDEPKNWMVMKEFYQTNIGKTMGVGAEYKGIWYPLPQVELPAAFRKNKGKYQV